MKYFAWNAEKNEQLKADRSISFEEVVTHIEKGAVLDILAHPNHAKYPGQRIFVVSMYKRMAGPIRREHRSHLFKEDHSESKGNTAIFAGAYR